jgi:hypothetical protein
MAAEVVDTPFAVINADDFYGAHSFKVLADFLKEQQGEKGKYCMVGFDLDKTLSESGEVSRGICSVDENNYLIALDNTLGTKRETQVTFKLLSGYYILPIKVTNTNLTNCTIKQGGTQLTNLLSPVDITPHKYGSHWYILQANGSDDIQLTFTVELDEEHIEEKRLLQILPLVRITFTTDSASTAVKNRLHTTCYELAQKYDPQLEFNYTAEFDAETQISDPLYSYSFFNPHHVMNSYTIGQAYFTRDASGTTRELVNIDDRVR